MKTDEFHFCMSIVIFQGHGILSSRTNVANPYLKEYNSVDHNAIFDSRYFVPIRKCNM